MPQNPKTLPTLSPFLCEQCKKHLRYPVYCSECDILQGLEELPNYFSLFSLPVSYQVDEQKILDAEEELILVTHPDLYSRSPENEKNRSFKYTTLLNEAKKRLLDPFERGKYLLENILGIPWKQHVPQDFLIEMFGWQEKLDEELNEQELNSLEETILPQIETVQKNLNQEFQKILKDSHDPTTLNQISIGLGKLKFLQNLNQRIQEQKPV